MNQESLNKKYSYRAILNRELVSIPVDGPPPNKVLSGMEGSNDSPPASDSPAGVSITGVPVLIPAPSLPVPLPQASTSSLADMAPPPPIPHVPTHALGAELLTPLSSHVPTHALGAESLTPLSSHAPTRALGVEGSSFPYGSTAGDTSWTNQITVYRDDWCDSSRVVYDKTRAAIMAGQRRIQPVRARVEHGTNVRRSVDSRQPNLVGAPEKRRRAPPAKASRAQMPVRRPRGTLTLDRGESAALPHLVRTVGTANARYKRRGLPCASLASGCKSTPAGYAKNNP